MPFFKEPIKFKNLMLYGVIRQAEVDDSLIPEGGVTHAINVHGDRKGAVTLRKGLTALGAQISAGYSCLGLYDALFETSANNAPLAVFSNGSNNVISRYSAGSWSDSLTGDTQDLKTRFTTFADRTIRVNGTNDMKCFDGTSWESSGNPINPNQMTSATKFIDVYKSTVYTSGNSANPDRLFHSSVISSSGNITWSPGTDFVDINPSDGENLTGLKRFSLELLNFKPNYIYRFRTTAADPDPMIRIGTRSNESIIEGKKGLYFHHDTGFYRYSGTYPKELSRPLSDFVDNIAYTTYENIVSWKDQDHIMFSVGDITIGGTTYNNVVLRYTESSDIWTVYSYGSEIKAASRYITGSAITRIVGDDDGYVLTYDSGYTDNGTAISYGLETKWYDLGSIAERKVIQTLIGVCEKAQGAKIKYQIDDNTQWDNLGTLTKYLNYFKNSISFHRIRFKLLGMSSSEPFIFQGLEILEGLNEGVIIE